MLDDDFPSISVCTDFTTSLSVVDVNLSNVVFLPRSNDAAILLARVMSPLMVRISFCARASPLLDAGTATIV